MPSCHYLDFIYVQQQCPFRTLILFPAREKVWCRTVPKASLVWLTLSISRKMSWQWLLKLCSDRNCVDWTTFLPVKVSPLHQRWWVELPYKCHRNLQLLVPIRTLLLDRRVHTMARLKTSTMLMALHFFSTCVATLTQHEINSWLWHQLLLLLLLLLLWVRQGRGKA